MEKQPDEKPVGRRPEQFLYNLLKFAAAVAEPEILNNPLMTMLGREHLSGACARIDRVARLLATMAYNQKGKALHPVWRKMLLKEQQFLAGRPLEGFKGVLHMPPWPAKDEICEALGLVANELESESSRRD